MTFFAQKPTTALFGKMCNRALENRHLFHNSKQRIIQQKSDESVDLNPSTESTLKNADQTIFFLFLGFWLTKYKEKCFWSQRQGFIIVPFVWKTWILQRKCRRKSTFVVRGGMIIKMTFIPNHRWYVFWVLPRLKGVASYQREVKHEADRCCRLKNRNKMELINNELDACMTSENI